ncbi:MAG: hypothetical protein EBS23_04060 [Betaproteobacteria bacterium]|nr:hypothetical protein [Betaproteobacteria bacterium]
MSFCICTTCGSRYDWKWEEAFDKFGFSDGGGLVMTETVADALRAAGYTVTVEPWGIHNVVITDLKRGRRTLIPRGTRIGYDNPRNYLPRKVVAILDQAFPEDAEVLP